MQIIVIYLHSEFIQQVNKVHKFTVNPLNHRQPKPSQRPLCLTAITASYYGLSTSFRSYGDVTFSSKAF